MANRHIARSVVLQSLFEVDTGLRDSETPEDALLRNVAEFAPEQAIFPFMKKLFDLVLAKKNEIDQIISKTAPEWPIDKIAVVDRNILRIGLAELLYSDPEQVPPKVAINEAIELAKEFGGESSGRFINGVLGAVYKEMKNDVKSTDDKSDNSKTKKAEQTLTKTEELVGAVVYAVEKGEIFVALVHDIFGHWTLSKGKLQDGEDLNSGVKRKVKEELGLSNVTIEEQIGENEYLATDSDSEDASAKKKRHTIFFLVKSDYKDLTVKKDGGLDDAAWFKVIDIVDLNFYDDMLPIITNAINILASKKID